MVNSILTQTIYYLIVMCLTISIIGMMQRGFLYKYLIVRASMGRKIIIKIRKINRDDFAVGNIDDRFCKFKDGKDNKTICMVAEGKDNRDALYKCLGVTFMDYDDITGGIAKKDFSGITTHDPIKEDALMARGLLNPIIDTTLKIIIIVLVVMLVVQIASLVISFKAMQFAEAAKIGIEGIKSGTLVGGM